MSRWITVVVTMGLFVGALESLRAQGSAMARTSAICEMCHGGSPYVFNHQGMDVSPYAGWSHSMMAFSANDPYWLAKMSAEVSARPGVRSLIENECLTCHAPLGAIESRGRGRHYSRQDLVADPSGLEGVSCIVCHRIEGTGLGQRKGMSGHFSTALGTQVYGPYPRPFPRPMWRHTGFVPTYSQHLEDPGLCGSCHNLYTPVFDDDLEVIGEFPEQVIYSEWLVSDYASRERTCQSCHLESIPIQTPIAPMPPWLPPRTPVWNHEVVGGNTFMLQLLGGKFASRKIGLERTRARTRKQLENKTLDVSLLHRASDEFLEVEVKLVNKTGHKFPTGYPERRVWIHVSMSDASGGVFFESGKPDSKGRVVRRGERSWEPHHDVIRSEAEVQIYEIVPANRQGEPTHRLLSASQAVKDNRLLPRGFRPARHDLGKDVAVIGEAQHDSSFNAKEGSDVITYRVRPPTTSMVTIDVWVYYQSIRPGAIDELRAFQTPDIRAFLEIVDELDELRPELIWSQSLVIQTEPR